MGTKELTNNEILENIKRTTLFVLGLHAQDLESIKPMELIQAMSTMHAVYVGLIGYFISSQELGGAEIEALTKDIQSRIKKDMNFNRKKLGANPQ